jgi:hypothetical protein
MAYPVFYDHFYQLSAATIPTTGAPMRVHRLLPVAAALILTGPLSAQDYSGSYAANNDQGGQTVVTLRQAGQQVVGTIVGNGNTFQIEGVSEEGAIVGAVTGAMGAFYFEAELDDGQLYFTLIEPDANGQPNYDAATTLVFAKQGGATAMQGGAGANPLAGGTAQDPWIGTFSDGQLVLQLQGGGGSYSGIAQLAGQSFSVSVTGSGSQLSGTFRAADGEYPLTLTNAGGVVTLMTGGTSYTLQRAGAAAAANPLAADVQPQPSPMPQQGSATGNPHDGTQLGVEWYQFLAGKKVTQMSSYSSGSAGGYSSRTDVHLCPNGQFALAGNSMVSADVGGASGYSGGNSQGSGTWRIITQGQLVGIELRYANGGVEQYQLDYQDGATYVNGERWYVTPTESCGGGF